MKTVKLLQNLVIGAYWHKKLKEKVYQSRLVKKLPFIFLYLHLVSHSNIKWEIFARF